MKHSAYSWTGVAVGIVLLAPMNCAVAAVLAHAEAGRSSTCVISDKGFLYCHGASVGNGSGSGIHTLGTQPTGLGAIKSISLSIINNFACVISADNSVWCWSSDSIKVPFRLQIPLAPAPLPLFVTNLSVGASAGISGDEDACGVLSTGKVFCWQFQAGGFNALNIQLVLGLDGQPISSITQVSVGYGFGCAVRSDSAVLCWGLNDAGQLARGTVTPNRSLFPAVAITGLNAKYVSAGFNHACALALDGTVKCWGADEYGQLGNGQSNLAILFPFASPQSVVGIANATGVSAGWEFTCAGLADASTKCWGFNDFGKVGRNTIIPTNPPLRVTHVPTPSSVNLRQPPLNYVVVSAGHDHACASGTYGGFHFPPGHSSGLGLVVLCWGNNAYGQLTDGTTKSSSRPVP
jgi:alpha-tubulin suppressor-like RCC1 family protein